LTRARDGCTRRRFQPLDAALPTQQQICIVTSASISRAPRVVKEADCLSAAGFDVRVFGIQSMEREVQWDAELMRSRPWRLDNVRIDLETSTGRARRYSSALRQRAASLLFRGGLRHEFIAGLAANRLYTEQLARLTEQSCALLIGHTLQTLPVVRAASRKLRVPYAFDAEDDHVGEFTQAEQECPGAQLVRFHEQRALKECLYVTAASPGMADRISERYGLARPTVIHNVFPLSERRDVDGLRLDRPAAGAQPALSIYWYSQTIGLDRGLQDMIAACAGLRGAFELHLRGDVTRERRAPIERQARAAGIWERLHFHPQVPPTQLLSRTIEHDVGVALEQPVSENRMHTVTNKLFFYMLAGLAIVATRTPGQSSVLATCPEAAVSYEPGDVMDLRGRLQYLLDTPDAVERMKRESLAAAQERWNWERESLELVRLVRERLGDSESRGS
jgi:glycosyltransferase involved in cell wall biosynthesis